MTFLQDNACYAESFTALKILIWRKQPENYLYAGLEQVVSINADFTVKYILKHYQI